MGAELTDDGEGAVDVEERNVRREVVLHRDGVDDEIEARRLLGHGARVGGDEETAGAERERVVFLAGGAAEHRALGPMAEASLTAR